MKCGKRWRVIKRRISGVDFWCVEDDYTGETAYYCDTEKRALEHFNRLELTK